MVLSSAASTVLYWLPRRAAVRCFQCLCCTLELLPHDYRKQNQEFLTIESILDSGLLGVPVAHVACSKDSGLLAARRGHITFVECGVQSRLRW